MLTHIVCFKYKPDTPESARQDHRARLRGLAHLDLPRASGCGFAGHCRRHFPSAEIGELAGCKRNGDGLFQRDDRDALEWKHFLKLRIDLFEMIAVRRSCGKHRPQTAYP